MSKTVITIEHLATGQPWPYADSKYRAQIKAERHGIYTNGRVIPYYLTENETKQLARKFVHSWSDTPKWHQSRLEMIRPVGGKEIGGELKSGEWEVLIIQPFLD